VKLAPRTYRIQWEVHAWPGVLASLLLFVVFFCGIFALFREDLEVWQDRALHVAVSDSQPSFDRMRTALHEKGFLPRGSRLGLSPHPGTRFVAAYITTSGEGDDRLLWIDPETGGVLTERSRLADELYAMHFFDRIPFGMEATGLLAVVLLVALVSGLLIHLKDLRRQWWRFRSALRIRFASSDAHKVLGVFGLPFMAMLGWSGAVLCLFGLVGQAMMHTHLGDAQRFDTLRGYVAPVRSFSDREARSLPLDELVRRAQLAARVDSSPRYLDITNDGDRSAWARVFFRAGPFAGDRFAFLDAVDGTVLSVGSTSSAPAAELSRALSDLHFARYGGRFVKILYALLALAACAVIVTGNLVWLERRDPQRQARGNRLLERLTVGVGCGLPLASAGYAAANRVLPWTLAHRAEWEFRIFLVAWLVAVASALLARAPASRVVTRMACATAVLFAGVVTSDLVLLEANLATALHRGLPAVFVGDALFLALALGAGGVAFGLARGSDLGDRRGGPFT
jgi:uncharacterized iron-regulated membrane protein